MERAILVSPSMRSSLGVGCDVVRGFVSLAWMEGSSLVVSTLAACWPRSFDWALVMEGFVGCIKLMIDVPISSSEEEVAKRIGVFSTVINFPGTRVWLAIT